MGGVAARLWELELWTRPLKLKNKTLRKSFSWQYKRPYLRHTLSGDVITVHNKAWNDTAGTAMWADVILGPYQVRRAAEGASLPLLLVWDNCGPHTVAALDEVFDEHKVLVRQLPPRMTSVLQIMDLVVNGPVKAAIRKARCND